MLQALFRTAAIGRVNLEGAGLEELLTEQVAKTSAETARPDALIASLEEANLHKATAESKIALIQAQLDVSESKADMVKAQLDVANGKLELTEALLEAEKRTVAK